MTKAEYIEICSQHWDEIEKIGNSTTLYELERDFDNIWTKLGKEVLEKSISEVPKNYRKKKD